MSSRASWRHLLLACALPLAVGCGGGGSDNPPTSPVSGLVTLGGTPVAGATVTFVPVDAQVKPAVGITDDSGRYQLTSFETGDGAMPGSYLIMVTKYEKLPAPEPVSEENYVPPVAGVTPPTPKPKNELPARYASPGSSGLKVQVQEGDNPIDLKLDP